MDCTYCDSEKAEIPQNQTEPMCHDCWCEMTEEGKDWWEAEYAKQGRWYEYLSQWDYGQEDE